MKLIQPERSSEAANETLTCANVGFKRIPMPSNALREPSMSQSTAASPCGPDTAQSSGS